jgi:hypothetical protein
MKPEKQKDAMSELVDILATSDTQDTSATDEGVVITPDGDKVTLGYRVLAQKLINAVRIKKANEKAIAKYFANKDKK